MFGQASKMMFLCFVQVAERISWVICDLSGNGLSLLIHRCIFTLSYPLRRTNPQASIESTSFLVWASLLNDKEKVSSKCGFKKSSLYPKPFPLANSGKQEKNGVKEMGLLYLFYFTHVYMNFPGGSDGQELPEKQETQVWSLGWEDPLEKGMALAIFWIFTWKHILLFWLKSKEEGLPL